MSDYSAISNPAADERVRRMAAVAAIPLPRVVGAGGPTVAPPDVPAMPPALPGAMAPAPVAPVLAPVNPAATPRFGQLPGESDSQYYSRTGPGVAQIKSTPLRVLARIGDIAGSIAAPGVMAAIPGTTLHNRALQSEAIASEDRAQKQADEELARRNVQSEIEDRAAQASERAAAAGAPEKLTPEEQTIHDLMTGNSGAPQINPETAKPYTYLEAYQATKQAGTAKPETRYERVEIADSANPGQPREAIFDSTPGSPTQGQILDPVTRRPVANARLYQKPPEPEKPPRTLLEVPLDPNDPSKGSRIIEAVPGMAVPAGARTPTQAGEINQMEQTRADMAENVNENLDQLADIVRRRPELFGPIRGRETKLRQWTGTADPDIAALAQIQDNLGRALTSAHGMRNGQLVERAIQGVLNGYKNDPKAIDAAINNARNSVRTFTADVQAKGGTTGASGTSQSGTDPVPALIKKHAGQ